MSILSFIIVLICFLLLVYIIKKTAVSKFTRFFILLFTSLWYVDLLLSVLDVVDVGGLSGWIVFVVICATYCFVLGFLLTQRSKRSKRINNIDSSLQLIDKKIERFVSSPITFVVFTSALILTIYEVILILPQLLLAGNLSGGLRVEALTGQLYSPLFYLVKEIILTPMYSIAITIFPYVIIRGRCGWVSLPICLYVIVFPMLTGGRMGYAIILLMFVAVYGWFLSSSGLIRENIRRVAIISFAVVLVLFSLMSVVKRGNILDIKGSLSEQQEESLFHEAVSYYVGPLKAFEYSVQHNYVDRLGGWQNGRATFAGVDHYINPIINNINNTHEPNENSRIGKIMQEEWISLGPGIDSWNALYTANLHFYLDFGFIGCLVFPLVFGLLAGIISKRVFYTRRLSVFFFLFYVIRMSLTSMLSFYPVEGDVLPFLFFIFSYSLFERSVPSIRRSLNNSLR